MPTNHGLQDAHLPRDPSLKLFALKDASGNIFEDLRFPVKYLARASREDFKAIGSKVYITYGEDHWRSNLTK